MLDDRQNQGQYIGAVRIKISISKRFDGSRDAYFMCLNTKQSMKIIFNKIKNTKPYRRFLLVFVVLSFLAASVWWMVSTQQHSIVISSGEPLGMYHEIALAIEDVIEKQHPEIDIVVETSKGSQANLDRIDRSECDLALVQNDALRGQRARSISSIYPEVLHLVCRRDANVKSIKSLEGKVVSLGPDGSGTQQVVRALFEFASLESTRHLKLTSKDAIAALNGGTIDAAFFLSGVPSKLIDDMLQNQELMLAPIVGGETNLGDLSDHSELYVKGFQTRYPFIKPFTIPIMSYHGRPAEPVPTLGVSAVLVSRADLSSGLVSDITKTIFENRVDLTNQISVFSGLNEEVATASVRFPVHEGAEYYYRRREPSFLTKNAEAMGFIVTLLVLGGSLLATSNRILTRDRKNNIDTFYSQIDEIMAKLTCVQTKEELFGLNDTLIEIDKLIRTDLINEKLKPDQAFIIFQNMYQNCESALAEKRRQLQELEV